jgi:hypothetical protein
MYVPAKNPAQLSAKESIHGIIFTTAMAKRASLAVSKDLIEVSKVSMLWKSDDTFSWTEYSFEETRFESINSIQVSFQWTSSSLLLVPLGDSILVAKVVPNHRPTIFEKFVIKNS